MRGKRLHALGPKGAALCGSQGDVAEWCEGQTGIIDCKMCLKAIAAKDALFGEMHPALADAFDFADYQINEGRDRMRVTSSFVTVAGALVLAHERGNPNKQQIVEALVRLLRAACDGPAGGNSPPSMDLQ